MIESFQIKKVATYDINGVEFKKLKKINFIYGTNGCGKTTISKFLHAPKDLIFNQCSIKWKADSPIKALVYNKDFRESNFGKGPINGVFTLGQATKEDIEIIDKKRGELLDIKDRGFQAKITLEEQTKKKTQKVEEFKEKVWVQIYKKHELYFKDAFKKASTKELFKSRILEEYKNPLAVSFSLDELKHMAKTIFGDPPTTKPNITTISFDRIVEIENDSVWDKKIIGKSDVNIAQMIQTLNMNDWVNEGRKLIQASDPTCPFCQQQTISIEFLDSLEKYFDKSFTEDTKKVNSLLEEYNLVNKTLISLLQSIETTEKANKETKLFLERFFSCLRTLESQSRFNIEVIYNKAKEPSRSLKLMSSNSLLTDIQELITDANRQLKAHNEIVADYTTQKTNLTKSIWRFIIEENKLMIRDFVREYTGLESGIQNIIINQENLRKRYSILNEEIKQLSKNVTSVQPSVDEINRLLKSYGFQNFEIVPYGTGVKKNQYQIHRYDGTLAESTLSEGEITFITFLYFLQLTKGSTSEESITEERVVVIDDPVSSLDSNVLFVVSSLIKELIKLVKNDQGNIKQIILLTHNVYFHKEVSFVDGKSKNKDHSCFWILRKNHNISCVHPYGNDNPIQNSYELLWRELKDRDRNSGITTQNIMRRIIENYFRILGKMGDDELIKNFPSYAEQEICRSLLCWINDGSHCFPDDLFIEHQGDLINQYHEVFKNIFNHSGHIEHYYMMMKEAV